MVGLGVMAAYWPPVFDLSLQRCSLHYRFNVYWLALESFAGAKRGLILPLKSLNAPMSSRHKFSIRSPLEAPLIAQALKIIYSPKMGKFFISTSVRGYSAIKWLFNAYFLTIRRNCSVMLYTIPKYLRLV